MIDQRRFGVQLLRGTGCLDHLLDFGFQVVALIHHVGDIGAAAGKRY